MLIAYALIIIFILLLCIAALVFAFLRIWSLSFTRSPFINVPEEIMPEILQALDLKNGSVLYDLGCGDASVLIAAAKKHSAIRCVGIDNNILPFFAALYRVRRTQTKNAVSIQRKNFFAVDLKNATHVFCYLFPGLMRDLEPKFAKKLRPGSRVVSCDFPLPNKKPIKVVDLERMGRRGAKLYVYDY